MAKKVISVFLMILMLFSAVLPLNLQAFAEEAENSTEIISGMAKNDSAQAEMTEPDKGGLYQVEVIDNESADKQQEITDDEIPPEVSFPFSDVQYLSDREDTESNMIAYYTNKYGDAFDGGGREMLEYYSEKYSDEYSAALRDYDAYYMFLKEYIRESDVAVTDGAKDEEAEGLAATGASDLNYTLKNGVLTVSCSGSWFDGKQAPWRSQASTITEVVIQSGTPMINQYAFYNCSNLKKVTIPSSVTTIGEYAFYRCSSLESVTFPDGLESIGDSAFRECSSLKTVTLPGSITGLSDTVFYQCTGLVSAVIDGRSESTGNNLFRSCTNLKTVEIKNGVRSIGSSCFSGCSSLTSIALPSSVDNIGKFAFNKCTSLSKINLSLGLTEIGSYAFNACESLAEITFPGNLSAIRTGAFWDCSSLRSVDIPSSVEELEDHVFYNCEALETVKLPNRLTTIKNSLFYLCKSLKSVQMPKKLETIEPYAFRYDESYQVSIPNTVKVIGINAFERCGSNGSIVIPDSVERIETRAFEDIDSVTRVSIGYSLATLGDNPFYKCSKLSSISLSEDNESLRVIDNVLYDRKDSLICYPTGKTNTSFTVPDGVREIGRYACSYGLANANPLKNVTLPDSVVSIGDHAFDHDYYSSAPITSFDSFRFSANLKEIGENAFDGCEFKSIDLPDSLSRIGNRAFYGGWLPSGFKIPKNVNSIGKEILHSTEVSSITVDASNQYYKSVNNMLLTKDGKELIAIPSIGMTSCVVPEGVEKISDGAMYNTQITSVQLPSSLKYIGEKAFSLTNLSGRLTIPDSVTFIGFDAVSSCRNLEEIIVGSGLSYLGYYAFSFNSKLKAIRFKGSAPTVPFHLDSDGQSYYSFCAHSPTVVYYPEGDSSWNELIQYDPSYGDGVSWQTWDGVAVEKIDISDCTIKLSSNTYVYDATDKKPDVTIKNGSEMLLQGYDYTVDYKNCINAGTATVNISGIGAYTGEKAVPYTIQKSNQTISATLYQNELKIKETAQITAKGIGSITYSSSDYDIAEVNGSGLITAKSAGKVIITVYASGDENYNKGSKEFNVTVKTNEPVRKPLTISDLTFGFTNSASDFGYSSTYRIPRASYEVIYPRSEADALYNSFTSWNGNCYGFHVATALFNVPDSGLRYKSFRSSATKVKDLQVKDYSSEYGIDVTRLLEALLSIQYDKNISKVEVSHRFKYEDFLNEVEKCNSGGPAVGVGFNGSGGHEITAYGLIKSGNTAKVKVYNNWYIGKEEYLEFKLDNKGKPTGEWTYPNTRYSSKSHILDYITVEDLIEVWANRNSAKKRSDSIMMVNADDFILVGSRGETLAKMEDGRFESYRDDIFEKTAKDMQLDSHMLYVPTDSYTVSAENINASNELEIMMINLEQSVKVTTESDNVSLYTDDVQALAMATVDGEIGEYYEVEFNSSMDYSNSKENLVYNGKSEGKAVTVGTSYGHDFNEKYTRSGYDINDDSYNVKSSGNTQDLTDAEIRLSNTVYTYDGNSARPSAVVSFLGNTLKEGVDYTTVYSGDSKAGTAQLTVYGINNYSGSASVSYTINLLDLADTDLTVDESEFSFYGKPIKPGVTVSIGDINLTEDVDYTVSYENNEAPGTATVTVTGINSCVGTKSASFNINLDPDVVFIGDTDGNGLIEIVDVTFIQNHLVGIDTPFTKGEMLRGDVDNSGELEMTDVSYIQRYLTYLRTDLPIGILRS